MAGPSDVRSVALSLPGVEERPQHGRPSWRTKTRWFAVLRDDISVLLWVESKAERDALIRAHPKKFFTNDHYEPDPLVVVQLSAVGGRELNELVTESWRLRAPRSVVKLWDAEGS